MPTIGNWQRWPFCFYGSKFFPLSLHILLAASSQLQGKAIVIPAALGLPPLILHTVMLPDTGVNLDSCWHIHIGLASWSLSAVAVSTLHLTAQVFLASCLSVVAIIGFCPFLLGFWHLQFLHLQVRVAPAWPLWPVLDELGR